MAIKDNEEFMILDKELFARRLTDVIYLQGSTQAKVSRATGIKECALSSYMSGEKVPNLKTIYALARYLDISIDYLVGNDEHVMSRLEEARNMYALERDDKARRLLDLIDEIGLYYQGARF